VPAEVFLLGVAYLMLFAFMLAALAWVSSLGALLLLIAGAAAWRVTVQTMSRGGTAARLRRGEQP
jgi:hypothetical protein